MLFRRSSVVPAAVAAFGVATALASCDRPQPEPSATEATRTPPRPGPRDSLTAADLGSLEVTRISLTLPWMSGLLTREAPDAARVAELQGMTLSREEGFDRVVMEFGDSVALPGYRVEYLNGPARECASGAEASLAGAAVLGMRLQPARARNEAGRPVLGEGGWSPGPPGVLEARVVCQEQDVLEWAFGMDTTAAFRILEMTRPARLVVDVQHTTRSAGGGS